MYTHLISPDQLRDQLHSPNWRIIDCRFSLADKESGRRDYRQGHIPGAIYAHLDEDLSGEIRSGQTGRHPLPQPRQAEALFTAWGIGPDTQVIAYDQLHGGIAARLWWMLRWLGHDAVAVLDGGWKAWTDRALPVSQEQSHPKPATFKARPRPEALVNADTVEKNMGLREYLLVDSRTAERYHGWEEPIDPIGGHIPGAVNTPFVGNVDEKGQFLSREQIRRRFDQMLEGKDPAKTIFYCGSGVTACHNLLAMDYAGLEGALLYPGSWSDWITDEGRPVKKDPGEDKNQ